MDENVSWTSQHRENALTMAVFAVFAAGLAWILGVLHVAVAYPERFVMAVIVLFAFSYVISDGVEVAIKRLFCQHTVRVVDSEAAEGTIFSGSEES